MGVEYFFEVFMYEIIADDVIRIAIAADDELMYHLCFMSTTDCREFQKVLHKLERELKGQAVEQQTSFLQLFIQNNPFEYPYQLLSAHEWFKRQQDLL